MFDDDPRTGADEVRRAMHAAVQAGDHPQLESLVLAHPGFVDAADDTGRSPLMHAVERGDPVAAALLLKAGASASTHAPGGSALEVAAGRADAALVELLLDHGARELRVAFRIAKEKRARPIMEMIAHREPTLQLQMEFDAAIPDQRELASERLTRRLPEPVLRLDGVALDLSWDGTRTTYVETLAGKPDRTFTVEIQHKLTLRVGEVALGTIDGMWYSALVSGPATSPVKLADGRWRVRYAYYAVAGAYQHYSAVDLTIDLERRTLVSEDVHDPEG